MKQDYFHIIRDTREKQGWKFESPYFKENGLVSIIDKALPFGDYSIVGIENNLVIERKSMQDFANSFTNDRARLEKEMQKANEANCTIVVILEDTWSNLFKNYGIESSGLFNRTVNPRSLFCTSMWWNIERGVIFYDAENYLVAQFLAFEILRSAFINRKKRFNKECKNG